MQGQSINLAESKTTPVTLAETGFRRLGSWSTAHASEIQICLSFGRGLALGEAVAVSGADAPIEIVGICGRVRGGDIRGQRANGIDYAELVSSVAVVISGLETGLKALRKGLPRPEARRIADRDVMQLPSLAARRPGHVDVEVAAMVALFVTVKIAVSKCRAGQHWRRAGLLEVNVLGIGGEECCNQNNREETPLTHEFAWTRLRLPKTAKS